MTPDELPQRQYGEPEPSDSGLYQIRTVFVQTQTGFQDMEVVETELFGRALFLDGVIQSAQTDESIYHETMIHPALVMHGRPRRVLVGGAGEGATLREILRHPEMEEVLAVDLDRAVVEASKDHLKAWHHGAFEDPRVTLRYEDVRTTLAENQGGGWDVVVMDVTDPIAGGPAEGLSSPEFYRQAAGTLSEDGVMIVQGGAVHLGHLSYIKRVLDTLREVFPAVHLLTVYVPSFYSLWGVIVCGKRPLELDPADLDARLARLPMSELVFYDAARHRALLQPPRIIGDHT